MTTCSRTKPLTIASFHDIHLGHHNTLTPDVIKGFDAFFKDLPLLKRLDYIFIPGDLFDRQLTLTNDFLNVIYQWIFTFLSVCKLHNIKVRLSLGTPGHDFNQMLTVIHLNEKFNIHADVKYFDKLAIEYIEEDNLTLLYVPDEWSIDPLDTYNQTLALLQQHGLTQVDFCLFHGAFNYQIDASLNPKAHDEVLWNKLVKHALFAGHVHVRSEYGKIFVAGSFDRLCHGEEQPKGYLLYTRHGEQETVEFIENKNATQYVTIDVRHLSIEDIIQKLDTLLPLYPERSHIRLHLEKSDTLHDGLKTIRQRYSFYYFTVKTDEPKTKVKQTLQLAEKTFNTIDLNPNVLERILMERLPTTFDKEKSNTVLKRFL